MSPSKKSFRSKPKNTLSRKIIVSPPGLEITGKRKPEGPGWACGFLMVVGLGFVGGGLEGSVIWVGFNLSPFVRDGIMKPISKMR